jgi:hypothetical protein
MCAPATKNKKFPACLGFFIFNSHWMMNHVRLSRINEVNAGNPPPATKKVDSEKLRPLFFLNPATNPRFQTSSTAGRIFLKKLNAKVMISSLRFAKRGLFFNHFRHYENRNVMLISFQLCIVFAITLPKFN